MEKYIITFLKRDNNGFIVFGLDKNEIHPPKKNFLSGILSVLPWWKSSPEPECVCREEIGNNLADIIRCHCSKKNIEDLIGETIYLDNNGDIFLEKRGRYININDLASDEFIGNPLHSADSTEEGTGFKVQKKEESVE